MKKSSLCVLCAAIMISVLFGGCANKNNTNPNTGKAMENTHLSQTSPSEINPKDYKQYEEYGLRYNNNDKRFYYKDKLARKFTDKKDAENHIKGFSFPDGEVDLMTQRDDNFKLIGIKALG